MELTLFFGWFFISLFLGYLYFSKEVIYFGTFAAIIMLVLGVFLAGTGDLDVMFCFSDKTNATTNFTSNITTNSYSVSCHTETLTFNRNYINIMGMIMMFMGGGMVMDIAFNMNERRNRRKRESRPDYSPDYE